jgi:hypothetical protein
MDDLIAQLLKSTDRCTVIQSILSMETEIEPSIPDKYMDYTYVFSKKESDLLPPYRLYDYKIELESDSEKSLKYSPLYKISIEELEIVKEYLTDNLSKGFIEPS